MKSVMTPIIECKLKNLTWLKVGGEAKFLLANDIDDLLFAIEISKTNKINIVTIGAGSNILATDNKINALIVKLSKNFSYISLKNNLINVGCATSDSELANFALKNNIADLEFFSTIPGTIGGAITMNAGAYNADTSMCLHSIKAIDMNGIIHIIPVEEMKYQYRKNCLNESYIFLEGRFKIKKGNYNDIQNKMNNMIKTKHLSQPIKAKTCGSFFKNALNHKAWQLIDDSGCRGMKIGDAEISTKHCNFLINSGKATSNDIFQLYKIVQTKVYNCFNIKLEPEVIILE